MKKLLSILLFLYSNHVLPAAKQYPTLNELTARHVSSVLRSETELSLRYAVYFVGTRDYIVLGKWFDKSFSPTNKSLSATLYEKSNKEGDEYREINIETTKKQFLKAFARAVYLNRELKALQMYSAKRYSV